MRQMLLLMAGFSMIFAGCGSETKKSGGNASSEPSALEKVTGTVTFNNVPVKAGTITFEPEGGKSAVGKIVDGKIQDVTTNSAGDGAPVGDLKVGIATPDGAKPDSEIPKMYSIPSTSGLTATVKKGGPNELKFELK